MSIASSWAGNSEISRLAVRWISWRLKWSLGRFILGAPVSLSVYHYTYASLNDGITFWEMRRWAISSLYERVLTQTKIVQSNLKHT